MTGRFLRIVFARKKDFGKEERELKWAHDHGTVHGLQPPDAKLFPERVNELNQMALCNPHAHNLSY